MSRIRLVQGALTLAGILVIAPTLAGQSAPRDVAATRIPLTERADSGIKSIWTGVAWSIGGLVVPIVAGELLTSNDHDQPNDGLAVLELAGFLIGPSLGHFYAGRTGRGLGGIGTRLLVTVGATAAVAAVWNRPESGGTDALGVLVLGAVTASIIWDIARVPGSVRRHNAVARSTGLTLQVTPIAGPSRLGIGARITF